MAPKADLQVLAGDSRPEATDRRLVAMSRQPGAAGVPAGAAVRSTTGQGMGSGKADAPTGLPGRGLLEVVAQEAATRAPRRAAGRGTHGSLVRDRDVATTARVRGRRTRVRVTSAGALGLRRRTVLAEIRVAEIRVAEICVAECHVAGDRAAAHVRRLGSALRAMTTRPPVIHAVVTHAVTIRAVVTAAAVTAGAMT